MWSHVRRGPSWQQNKESIKVYENVGPFVCRDVVDIDGIDRLSMACPAMPLCGLAIGEAERALPDINRRIRALLGRLGFDESEQLVVRMTGCPNGCTRPYMAELGFVGDGPNSYQIWLGGTPAQTRLAEPFLERVKVQVGPRSSQSVDLLSCLRQTSGYYRWYSDSLFKPWHWCRTWRRRLSQSSSSISRDGSTASLWGILLPG